MIRRVVLLLALALSGCGGSDSGNNGAAGAPSALVTLAIVQAGGVEGRTTLYGAADAGSQSNATLTAPADARVVRVFAPVGSAVAAGQAVAQLAPAPTTQLDLVRAESDARAADAAFARQQRLRADGLVGNAEVEQARAAAAGADATRASLQARTAALTLRAPFAGYVQTVANNPGEQVAAGAVVVTLTRSAGLRARFGVDPRLAQRLHPGQPIHIVPSSGGTGFVVPIAAVAPIADPQTRLISVFADLPAQSRVAAGETLTGQVAATAPDAAGQLTIPYVALLDDGDQPYVYTVTGGTAHRRDVAAGTVQGDRVAVSGLAAGDRVVVEGGTALEDGMAVRVR